MTRPCEQAHPEPVPDVCGLCWKFLCNPGYREKWGGDPRTVRDDLPYPPIQGEAPKPKPALPIARRYPRLHLRCVHEGAKLPGEPCGSPLHVCGLDGAIYSRIDPCASAARCCQTCPNHTPRSEIATSLRGQKSGWPAQTSKSDDVAATAARAEISPRNISAPRIVARFDETNLWPGTVPGLRFNPSLLAHGDGYLFAARNGWAGSEVWVGRLDRDLRPVGPPRALKLWHEMASHGREDPRLFYHEGRPHIAYVGVTLPIRTHVLYARLTADGMASEAVWYPEYKRRRYWEKSWSCLSHGGQIYAVYGIAPRHRIVRLDGDRATTVYDTPTPHPWAGGEPRGGASAVLIGDEWYSFFHAQSRHNGAVAYEMGVYTFENKPPFRVRRFTASAIDVASWKTKPRRPRGSGPNRPVIFPCGAVLDGDRWLVSMGVHDGWAEIREYSAADIEARLA